MGQKILNYSEIWKEVPGFDSIYTISNYGRVHVKSCLRYLPCGQQRNYKAKYLLAGHRKGYKYLVLCHPKKRKIKKIALHVLVAQLFIGPRPTSKHEVNHIDGVKTNCWVSNLEWVTPIKNQEHAYQHGLKKIIKLPFQGKMLTANVLSKILGISQLLIYSRLKKGYPINAVLDTTGKLAKEIKANAIRNANYSRAPKYKDDLTVKEWANKLGITTGAFKFRLKKHRGNNDLIYHKGRFPRGGLSSH